MEATLYDDSNYRPNLVDFKSTKRPVTLDLDSPANAKKQRIASILTSPDLQMLKLASPELERFIIAQAGGAITTTPTPTQFLFPKDVTEEQEKYAKGFVDALALLHQGSDGSAPNFAQLQFLDATSTSTTSANGTVAINPTTATLFYSHLLPVSLQTVNVTSAANPVSSVKPSITTTTVTGQTSVIRPPSVDSSLSSNSYQGCSSSNGGNNTNATTFSSSLSKRFSVKEELQMVPSDNSNSTPPMSPINLEDQERIKLERKRYRNRIAASKCRRRKLERIAKLEEKVSELKNENTELASVATKLREQVCTLKQEVLDHVKNGCQIMITHAF